MGYICMKKWNDKELTEINPLSKEIGEFRLVSYNKYVFFLELNYIFIKI